MTEQQWSYHTPERDGHAPDDWAEGLYVELEYSASDWRACLGRHPFWSSLKQYRYRPLQDATYEPDLLAQCLALPQADRDALIEAMQKPQRDWADEVWFEAFWAWDPMKADGKKAAAVIRSMCRPKELPKFSDMWLRDAVDSINRTSRMGRAQKLADIIREALS